MGHVFLVTSTPAPVSGLTVETRWALQHVSPRGRVKLLVSITAPDPGDDGNIMRPLDVATVRLVESSGVGSDWSLWAWSLDAPTVKLFIEGADDVLIRR